MIKINAFEKADRTKGFKEQGLSGNIYWAYRYSQEAGSDLLDFNEAIFDEDVEEIVKFCREQGIKEFTISSNFSGLVSTLDAFDKLGCKMNGLTQVPLRFTEGYGSEKHKVVPAIKMSL